MELLDEDDVFAILSEQVQRAGGQTAWAKKFGSAGLFPKRLLMRLV
jgi:hypothetical protein